MKKENPMIADLMDSIKTITADYVAKLPAEKVKFIIQEQRMTTVDIAIEIDLPSFTSNLCHFYKIYSEDKCLQVCTLEGSEHIGIHSASLAFNHNTTRYCSEDKFLEAYEKTLQIINNHLIK